MEQPCDNFADNWQLEVRSSCRLEQSHAPANKGDEIQQQEQEDRESSHIRHERHKREQSKVCEAPDEQYVKHINATKE